MSGEDMLRAYDLEGVCDLIMRHDFNVVVLQFPDENLSDAIEVYSYIQRNTRVDLELYITADSTYGSSVDDVSALHVNCKLLVYFGSDMSVSGSMPVAVCPKRSQLDLEITALTVLEQLSRLQNSCSRESTRKALIFLEPAYFHVLDSLVELIRSKVASAPRPFSYSLDFGLPPSCVNLRAWSPGNSRLGPAAGSELIGGMLVPLGLEIAEEDAIVVIGEKHDQIINICLRYSNTPIVCYGPLTGQSSVKSGVAMKEYKERYLGVTKVKDANVIGLIVGSMGLSGDIVQTTLNRLQILIKTAGKKSYTLVMGRLNEAKLRNFPEIDIYCLLSNDDTSLISPKTFHIPVITPFELELGLGARDWESKYIVGGFVGTSSEELAEELFEQMVARVRMNRPEDAIDVSDDEGVDTATAEDKKEGTMSMALTNTNSERRLADKFVSPAADFLKSREFQGLDFAVPENHPLDVVPGHFGTASGYKLMDRTEVMPVPPEEELKCCINPTNDVTSPS